MVLDWIPDHKSTAALIMLLSDVVEHPHPLGRWHFNLEIPGGWCGVHRLKESWASFALPSKTWKPRRQPF